MASSLCMPPPSAIPLRLFSSPTTTTTTTTMTKKNKRKADLDGERKSRGIILLQQHQHQQPQPQERRTSARLSSASSSSSASTSSSSSASASSKRPRLSAPPTPTPTPPPSPQPTLLPTPSTSELTPPPTPILSHKILPLPPSRRTPSPPPPHRPSRYQHFTSPLCPRPLSAMTVPHLNPKCRRTIVRASSPPHHSGRWNGSLLQWTLQKNHCLAVRQRQYLAAIQTQPSSSSSLYHTPLQIYPYSHSHSSSSNSQGESDDSDESSDDEDNDWGEGWDEGECEIAPEQESNWRVVVPSQHYSTSETSMRIPRACTPPNSPEHEKMDEDDDEQVGEPIVIKEGVTTIVLT